MESNNKKQVIVIHGGDTFDTYEEYLTFLKSWKIDWEKSKSKKAGWKNNLTEMLGEDYEVVLPSMPNKMNAKYLEWKIWFEKLVPHFNPEIILVGHSLGGTFLAKYLSENNIQSRIRAAFLVAPAYDDAHADYSMADFVLPEDLSLFQKQAQHIYLYHSKDDGVVPFADLDKFRLKVTNAQIRVFEDRGHFDQEILPELVEDIKSLFV
jgi:predicted alpha/beta hydrolase family esterase